MNPYPFWRLNHFTIPVERLCIEPTPHCSSAPGSTGTIVALINNAPNPNAAKMFINWFLSRAGQTAWQTTMNTKVQEPSDSMRVDIPKDKVSAPAKREESKKYRVSGFL